MVELFYRIRLWSQQNAFRTGFIHRLGADDIVLHAAWQVAVRDQHIRDGRVGISAVGEIPGRGLSGKERRPGDGGCRDAVLSRMG